MPSAAPTTRSVPRWSWLLPAAVLLLAFHYSPFGLTLDRAFFDAASRRPFKAAPLPENSAIVLIDDQTMSALSEQGLRWPYPRAVFAQLVAALHKAGAKKIVMDFTFFEESNSAEQDLLLASVAGAATSVVLAQTTDKPPVLWNETFVAAHPGFFSKPRTGLVELQADNDGLARSYHVPGSLAAAAFDPPARDGGGLLRWHGSLDELRDRGVPVYSAIGAIQAGRPIIERLLTASPDLVPEQIAAALEAESALDNIGAASLRGRTVFVGTNASGTFDMKPLPVGKIEPGVLIHWTAWANLSSGGFITAVPRWAMLLIAAATGAALLGSTQRQRGLAAPALLAFLFAGLGVATAYAALSFGWFLPPSSLVAACGLTLLGVVAERYWREQARKREIQAMFGAYVDPAVVANLLRNPASLRLGGERREATVFFSDLAGFTDLSEKLRDEPERMVEVVNAYLEDTSECLHREGAYVDKYIGDAVMAVFGVPAAQPDHALAACRAALAAQRTLDGINTRYAATGVTLAVRIGLNTGEMIVGNLGSSRKKNYTVMGDSVNLASRLEGANKEFGTGILLGETTARAVAGRMATRPLTRLRVKGKLQAVEVHELVGAPESLTPAQRAFLEAYLPAYASFVLRGFAEAAAGFSRALAARPDDAVTAELLRQAQEFTAHPPPADWEPILTLHSK